MSFVGGAGPSEIFHLYKVHPLGIKAPANDRLAVLRAECDMAAAALLTVRGVVTRIVVAITAVGVVRGAVVQCVVNH